MEEKFSSIQNDKQWHLIDFVHRLKGQMADRHFLCQIMLMFSF